jgi:hypothetical protein
MRQEIERRLYNEKCRSYISSISEIMLKKVPNITSSNERRTGVKLCTRKNKCQQTQREKTFGEIKQKGIGDHLVRMSIKRSSLRL